ncbi:hypothetical protein [Desulfosporosinus sp. BICA1-9]|uniref:hypothetical protein n=1 Tax=Desulfosporosinus sp. BICA1-9 TaxID=1531958 RepID=UPI00054C1C02|nr:hypothetical protein [Desulfosporosinus sp. BICA1-9]KJS47375.1 MAG: hypothetical protein VR66_20005 [Peptococcaceae bacterium BRH_c23]KJS88517.1 MAG: hypothetical protein JL57_11885 [Desulfosporosinus sp. BICA1-9]
MLTSDEELISHKSILNLFDSLSPIPQEHGIEEIMPIEQMEKQMIRLALKRFGDSAEGKKQAAKALKKSLATLYNKLRTMT